MSRFIHHLSHLLIFGLLWLPAVAAADYTLDNPLAVTSIQELLVAILRVLIIIATPIVIIMIVFAGFKYVTAQGNAQQVQEATRALLYAIIGGVIIIGAVAITAIIEGLVSAFQK